MDDDREILVNRIRTPDGTILISRHIHDYVTHLDKNGETYMVDGGNMYLRRSVNIIPAEELSVFIDDDFEKIRNSFYRWNTKINKYVTICDMDDDWVANVVKYYKEICKEDNEFPLSFFIQEHRHRELNKLINET